LALSYDSPRKKLLERQLGVLIDRFPSSENANWGNLARSRVIHEAALVENLLWQRHADRRGYGRNNGGQAMKMSKMVVYAGALLLPVGIAIATNHPDLKEGLWSIHTQTIDNPGNKKSDGSFTLCRSHSSDQAAEAHAKSIKGCTASSESFEGNKYSIEMHCTVGATVIDSKGTTTFGGDTSTHSENHATYTPAMAGISETTMIQDQKYLGSCPAGVQPGDRTNADGTVIHLGK
jgi:hypothetical protein